MEIIYIKIVLKNGVQAKLSMCEPVSCPFCRIEWKTVHEKNVDNNSKGYLNLAAYSTTDEYDEEVDDLFFNYW